MKERNERYWEKGGVGLGRRGKTKTKPGVSLLPFDWLQPFFPFHVCSFWIAKRFFLEAFQRIIQII